MSETGPDTLAAQRASQAERHARHLARDPRLRAARDPEPAEHSWSGVSNWTPAPEIGGDLRLRAPAVEVPAVDLRSEPALPSMAQLAVNAIRSGVTVARAKAADLSAPVLASPELLAARLRVCMEGEGLSVDQIKGGHCDHYRPSDDRCAAGDCGCYLARIPGGMPGRAALAALDCPRRRWPAILGE